MQFTLTEEGDLLEITVSGKLTKVEILALWESIGSYSHLAGGLVRVVAGSWLTSGDEIQDLARMSGQLPAIRWAFVAGDPASFGMFRMFSSWTGEEGRFRVFHEENAARNWLLSW
jgi:hypothetical protein